jgi:hypothetical protein
MKVAIEPRRLMRSARWSLIGLALVTVLTAAGPEPKTADPIIELPKFVVTDSRELPPPESWRYTRLPGFEVLSNASDRATQQLLKDFEMFRQALNVVWPMPQAMNTPVLLILCGRGGKFESFVPAKTDAGPAVARASVYLKGRERSAIVIDVESTVINLASPDFDDPASGVDSTQLSIEHNKQLYREYVHYLLSRSQPRLPAWFEEGMAQIVMAMQFNPKWIEFGRIHDANTVSAVAGMTASVNAMAAAQQETSDDGLGTSVEAMASAPAEDRDFNAALMHRALMPMAKLLAVGHDDPIAVNPLGNNVWAKQCYAFVHMGLFGERGQWRKPFSEFLVRSTREPVTEAMFKDCFKMSFRDMGIQLRGYVEYTNYESQIYRAKDKGSFLEAAAVELRDATPAEVGRIKGQAMLLAGNTAGARTEFIAPYIRGDRDPQLLTALGLSEHQAGKDDRARKFLDAAVAGKSSDPDAYLQLAKFRFADAEAAPAAAGGRFSTEQLSAITSLLLTARTLPPPNPETYDLLAETLARSSVRLQRPDLAPLVEGVQRFPGHLKLVYATAALCADAGLIDSAHSLVDYGLGHAPDPATKALFQRLQAALPPIAVTSATPSGPPAPNAGSQAARPN